MPDGDKRPRTRQKDRGHQFFASESINRKAPSTAERVNSWESTITFERAPRFEWTSRHE